MKLVMGYSIIYLSIDLLSHDKCMFIELKILVKFNIYFLIDNYDKDLLWKMII